jgi:hypothetical protein
MKLSRKSGGGEAIAVKKSAARKTVEPAGVAKAYGKTMLAKIGDGVIMFVAYRKSWFHRAETKRHRHRRLALARGENMAKKKRKAEEILKLGVSIGKNEKSASAKAWRKAKAMKSAIKSSMWRSAAKAGNEKKIGGGNNGAEAFSQ